MQFPNMIGGWGGTFTIGIVQVGTNVRTSNVCDETWVITSQTGASFSGTFQLAGGTTSTCAQSGNVGGTVSASGAVSGLTHSVALGVLSQCTRVSGDGVMTGVVSNASALTAQCTDRLRCTVGSVTSDNDRTLSLSLNKR
jgi:hypothetical protein